jgi:hypothetical protein
MSIFRIASMAWVARPAASRSSSPITRFDRLGRARLREVVQRSEHPHECQSRARERGAHTRENFMHLVRHCLPLGPLGILLLINLGCGPALQATTDGGIQNSAEDDLDRTGRSCNRSSKADDPSGPDLAVDRLNSSMTYNGDTTELKVGFSYGNIGKAAAGPYQIGIFLYPNVTDRCQAYFVSFFKNVGLEASHLHSGTATLMLNKVGDLPPGPYEVGYVLDLDNVITEASEANNTRSVGTIRFK